MKTFILVLLVLACSQNSPGGDPPPGEGPELGGRTEGVANLGEEFTVPYGGKVELEGEQLTVEFTAVVGDSRCPVDVTCIWEGNAEVEVKVEKAGEEAGAVRLNTSGSYATEAVVLGYRIELVEVRPPARSDVSLEPEDYELTLVVTREP